MTYLLLTLAQRYQIKNGLELDFFIVRKVQNGTSINSYRCCGQAMRLINPPKSLC